MKKNGEVRGLRLVWLRIKLIYGSIPEVSVRLLCLFMLLSSFSSHYQSLSSMSRQVEKNLTITKYKYINFDNTPNW